ncbi:MAG: DUF202 domain-containing protein [Gammaproteobacteria bacterium]|nr:DUF202 domain-containing protein [Gammaproteobacteria bacterium]
MHEEASEQTRIMQRMLELAERQTELSEERTQMAANRSRMSEDRSRMSADRSRWSQDRSELSAERSYMNTERTLSNWTRTALALMVFGIAVDRLGLLLRRMPGEPGRAHMLSTWGGAALIALGVVVVVAAGTRFLAYGLQYQRQHTAPKYHGPYLATSFAVLVALFGVALLIALFAL